MTPHTCRKFNPGCYRCDLGRDEVRAAREMQLRDALQFVIESPHLLRCRGDDWCSCGKEDAADLLVEMRAKDDLLERQ